AGPATGLPVVPRSADAGSTQAEGPGPLILVVIALAALAGSAGVILVGQARLPTLAAFLAQRVVARRERRPHA
ncbi:MAG: hypothetical protein M3N29_03975, partial [Chloroflexota bacterium]|nr:hypothetical protein [Chloroflexota bacterium]